MGRMGLAIDGEWPAWLALALVEPLAPRSAFALVERFGSPGAVLNAGESSLRAAGLSATIIAALGAVRPEREISVLARVDATLVTWPDAEYPVRLRHIPDPPLALAVRGALAADEPAIAVVGARRASEYGRRIAEELARGLAQAGVTVVSGLATGIDGAAHRAALAAGGRTVAVFGTGIDRVYPSWHRGLAAAIAARGGLVREFPCGAPRLQFHFPRRNRIISGLTRGTVVVEAAEQSGSLITARCALEQDRDLFAVPGPAGVPGHRGPNGLIRQGARLVTCAE